MKTVIRLDSVPPTTNSLYANVAGRGRIKTDRYRVWRNAAGWELKRYHNQRWTEPVFLTIAIGGLRRNADISNRIKALEDLLVEHGIIQGDTIEHVRGVNVYVAPDGFKGIEIAITPADGMMPCPASKNSSSNTEAKHVD